MSDEKLNDFLKENMGTPRKKILHRLSDGEKRRLAEFESKIKRLTEEANDWNARATELRAEMHRWIIEMARASGNVSGVLLDRDAAVIYELVDDEREGAD